MIAETACERNAGRKFQEFIERHRDEGSKGAFTINRCRETDRVTLGDAVYVPKSDVHHVLDSDIMLGVSHAIEDLAEDIGEGELIATFQEFKNFEPQRDRYNRLARRLNAVRVWGSGPKPKGCPKIDFISAADPKVKRYWLVLFDSPRCRAILLCRQLNRAKTFDKKHFIGFYSFNPYLVQSVRWRFNLLSSGLSRILAHWEKVFPFPDAELKDVAARFRELK